MLLEMEFFICIVLLFDKFSLFLCDIQIFLNIFSLQRRSLSALGKIMYEEYFNLKQ